MRRRWTWLGLVALVAVAWWALRWLEEVRRSDAPGASQVARGVEADGRSEPRAVEEQAPAREVVRAEEEGSVAPPVPAEHPSDAYEFTQRVRVVDTDGAPVSGARVWVPRVEEVAEVATDGDGRCGLRGDPSRLFMTAVAVRADGFFPGHGMLAQQPELLVTLRRSALAHGRVLDRQTGAPVAGARVSSYHRGGDVEAAAVDTDGSGRFEGLVVPEGESFLVDVEARGYLRPGKRAMSLVGDPTDAGSVLELLLERAMAGHFLVVDSEDGEPLAGATVRVGRSTFESDVDGRVLVDTALRPNDLAHSIFVAAPGHCSVRFEVQESGSLEAPVVLRVPRASRVDGVVLPAEGEQLPRCWLRVQVDPELAHALRDGARLPVGPDSASWPENAEWVPSYLQTEFDGVDSGRFVIEGVPPGIAELHLWLSVEAGTLARRTIGPLGGPGSTLHVDWQLEPTGTAGLTGRILRVGEPHAGFVRVERDGIERVFTTGDDGRYAFEGLTAGPLELYCELRGGGTRWGDLGERTERVTVTRGEVTEHDLEFDFAVGAIRGTLVDGRGDPLGGVQVRASNDAIRVASWCETADDGSWSFLVPVVETTYLLSCRRSLREEGLQVPAGTEGVALHEVARGRLRFRVLDAVTGEVLTEPVLAKPVSGNLPQPICGPTWPDMQPSGWCEKELSAGTIELAAFVHGGSYRSERRVLEIPAEGLIEAEFRLAPAVVVEVRLDPEGEELPEYHVVQLLPEGEWELATAESGPRFPRVSFEALPFDPLRKRDLRLWPGRAVTVGGLAPGRYRFKVFPDDVVIEPEVVDVPAAGVVDVRWSAKP